MKWIEPEVIAVHNDLLKIFPDSLLLTEQLMLRDISTGAEAERYIDPSKYQQTSPFVFDDMDKITDRIIHAIQSQECIGIWGDFDVDGQTATALLVYGLSKAGAKVKFHIPVRASESHGIKIQNLDAFLGQGIDLLITCDTGISEIEALSYAHREGVDVIVSDHHTPDDLLPPAYAIINPHFLTVGNAFCKLAGVGVAFQIIRALYTKMKMAPLFEEFYDLVAMGTIADVAPLILENRFYTQMGLKSLNDKVRPSIKILLEVAGLRDQPITENIISFIIAPRLNAVGRLADANDNVKFLLSDDLNFLRKSAEYFESLNDKRKILVDAVLASCEEKLGRHKELLQYPVILLQGQKWEKGVIGIAASQLAEIYNKPTILISTDGETSSGSARSIDGINIIRAIKENHEYLTSCGGHAMAAGLSLPTDQIEIVRNKIADSINSQTKFNFPEKKIRVDAYIDFRNINSLLGEEINLLSPFGAGNPAPTLVTKNVSIESRYFFGKNNFHRKILVKDSNGVTQEAIWWNSHNYQLPDGLFDLAYTLRDNFYNSHQSLHLEWVDYRPSTTSERQIVGSSSKISIQDYRFKRDDNTLLYSLAQNEDIIFWGEGLLSIEKLYVNDRNHLVPKYALAILTPPPDDVTLKTAFHVVQPKKVFLFNQNAGLDAIDRFLKYLSGLLKYAVNKNEGAISIKQLAAKMGHQENTILLGLEWWQAHGDIIYSYDANVEIVTSIKKPINRNKLAKISHKLNAQLSETAAFRSYYQRADCYQLINCAI